MINNNNNNNNLNTTNNVDNIGNPTIGHLSVLVMGCRNNNIFITTPKHTCDFFDHNHQQVIGVNNDLKDYEMDTPEYVGMDLSNNITSPQNNNTSPLVDTI